MRGAVAVRCPEETSERATLPVRSLGLKKLSLMVAKAAAIVLVLFLATFNLEYYPTTWFDEGSHLHVPKTLVQYGVYADISSEGFRYFGPTTAVGPTVMLPVAAAFKLAGIGLVQARTVMVLYLVGALLLFFLAGRFLYGVTTAWASLLVLVSVPGIDLLYLGRQVLGEVPALAFLLLGFMLWWRAVGQGSEAGRIVLAGTALGLAALTKSQYALVLLITLAVMPAIDHFYYRQVPLRFHLIPLAMVVGAVGIGYAAQLLPLLGSEGLGQSIALWREATAGAILVFSPSRILSSLKFLLGPDVAAFWTLPALVYGVFLARERSVHGVRQALPLVFALAGLAWYAFGSIGWTRYAFPSLAVGAIFVGKLFTDLIRGQRDLPGLGSSVGRGRVAALLLVLALIVSYGLADKGRAIASASDRGPQLMADYLKANVPETEIIETWEPEMGFLTDHRYHYPPSGWLDRAVRARWLGREELISSYDPIGEVRPAYLLVGPFGKYSGIYSEVLASTGARHEISIGNYDLYRLR